LALTHPIGYKNRKESNLLTMTQLKPIQLDDETIIYIEVTEDVDVLEASDGEPGNLQETKAVKRGPANPAELQKKIIENFAPISHTIRAYTVYTLNAFKKVAIANVDKVTLEFGIEVGGEAGVPYVTKGTAKSNLKITVECSFPEQTESKPSQASNS
jgi:hypothetical protein